MGFQGSFPEVVDPTLSGEMRRTSVRTGKSDSWVLKEAEEAHIIRILGKYHILEKATIAL